MPKIYALAGQYGQLRKREEEQLIVRCDRSGWTFSSRGSSCWLVIAGNSQTAGDRCKYRQGEKFSSVKLGK